MTGPTFDFDFAVAGAGPAGCATAIALASKGHRVVVLERERFPRFHIGESLIATANESFAALGLEERIAAADFPVKWGAQLATHDGRAGRPVEFDSSDEVPRPQTWQVCREKFDQILVERAREAGAEVNEGCRVQDVDFSVDHVALRCVGERGDERRLIVRAVVDATGRNGLLSRKLGLRVDEPRLANVAIYAHYAGVPRLPGRNAGDIRLIARQDAGWFWLIPIDDRLTSVGVVLPKALYARLEKGDPERMLVQAIAETPAVAELMAAAEREWPVRVERDFSYRAKRYSGERWLLAGDAGSFLDPVFSTGVTIALESGIEAARALDRAARAGDFSAGAFRGFERRQRRRFEVYRRFALAFYTPWFRDLFFQPGPPPILFRAVVTVLAGIWRPRLATRLLVHVFFFFVALQRRFRLVEPVARRDAAAGFQGETVA
ncbi:MAG: tryptophan 7-halogenase [Holophagales bacterium]|nr:tryptophan 7-halogenase [Holophagales bacterium]